MHTPPGLSRFHRTRPGARLTDRLPDHGCGDRSLLSPHRSVILAQEIVAVNAVVPLSHASVQPAPAASTLADSVGDAVRRYLEDMGPVPPDDVYETFLAELEQPLLREVMAWAGGNQSRAAQTLGMSRATLRKKLQRYGLR